MLIYSPLLGTRNPAFFVLHLLLNQLNFLEVNWKLEWVCALQDESLYNYDSDFDPASEITLCRIRIKVSI